jgi:hypothetical protein
MPNNTEVQVNTAGLPTHDEIQKRAYDLYLKGGEGISALEHWLIAEEELKKERAATDAKQPKGKTVAAAAGSVLKRPN